jgi:vacuolar-type H+-ATPase subunit I/STV1
MHKDLKKRVLEIFREFYPGTETDAEILKINPNSFDMDPEGFYEALIDEFYLDVPDPDVDSFYSQEGIGGEVSKVIKFIGLNQQEKPAPSSDPFCELDILFSNIEIQERTSELLDENLESVLDMFKYELRDSFKTLKIEAARVIQLKQYDQILKIIRDNKVKHIKEQDINHVLETIINF